MCECRFFCLRREASCVPGLGFCMREESSALRAKQSRPSRASARSCWCGRIDGDSEVICCAAIGEGHLAICFASFNCTESGPRLDPFVAARARDRTAEILDEFPNFLPTFKAPDARAFLNAASRLLRDFLWFGDQPTACASDGYLQFVSSVVCPACDLDAG